ncbi:protein NO VEIN domain-containing protein [Roseibium sp.]|uniref:protein NO VEIN domain-containing protein n=1 Tax=Roseibium sp. TaxID=1936156 RepID=UPI0039EE1939
MRDLPTRGRCHAIFLLAFSARVRDCCDLSSWIDAALDKPTHMAASLDVSGAAKLMLDSGLASFDSVATTKLGLEKLNLQADLNTLKGIARLLLCRRPPDWLRAVVVDGRVALEFIPQDDLRAISWLNEDLESIILSAHHYSYGEVDERLRKQLGDVGELAIMSALRRENFDPRHASLISDRFGYDIEIKKDNQVYGLEVKAAVPATAHRTIISRNEFEVANRMKERWRLIQVIFSSRIFARRCATAHDIEAIRELSSQSLVQMAPIEGDGFSWLEVAEFRPTKFDWETCNLRASEDFVAYFS